MPFSPATTDGLYMPFGHTRGGRKQAGARFVVANDQGRLSVNTRHRPDRL